MNKEVATLSSWEEFLDRVMEIRKEYKLPEDSTTAGGLIFRGQADSEWGLVTSLERIAGSQTSLMSYYRKALCCLPQVEAFIGKTWEIPTYEEYGDICKSYDKLSIKSFELGLEFLIYLRHHGFPSPFLDWSRSPHIASFFAFQEANPPKGYVSIFCFLETMGHGKGGGSNQSFIQTIGPYVMTHKRHHLQQSNYTRCIDFNGGNPQYVNHYSVINKSVENQDYLWEFKIPSTEKTKTLIHLDMVNINAFSLYGSEESLMSTVAFREFEIRGIDP
jgi:hypothetical protein